MNKEQQQEKMTRQRPSWDTYFLNIAAVVATRSHDAQTQVGAVIVDEHHRILATGYNGFPPDSDDDALPNTRPEKYPYMIHAEINAITSAHKNLRNTTLYCLYSPCKDCTKAILAAGIKTVVYQTPYLNDDHSFVHELLTSRGVTVRSYLSHEPVKEQSV